MKQATLNVRMPEALKRSGDKVLSREGISVSKAVRKLYEYLDEQQEFPDVLDTGREKRKEKIAHRRAAAESMVGILSPDVDFEEVLNKRRLQKNEPGVRA